MSITSTDELTALNCLSQSDWRLDIASDNYFQDPARYYVEPPRPAADKKKIEALFNKYRSGWGWCMFMDECGRETCLKLYIISVEIQWV